MFKNIIARLKSVKVILFNKHWVLYSLDDVNLIKSVMGKDFVYSYSAYGFNQVAIDELIKGIYFSRDNIDKLIDKAIFEAQIER